MNKPKPNPENKTEVKQAKKDKQIFDDLVKRDGSKGALINSKTK